MNPDTVDPIPTLVTFRTFVSESHDLTLASVFDVCPTTRSLYPKLPRPVIIFGSATVTVGAIVYPIPGSVTRIEDRMVFDTSMIADAVAVVPDPGPATVMTGGVV